MSPSANLFCCHVPRWLIRSPLALALLLLPLLACPLWAQTAAPDGSAWVTKVVKPEAVQEAKGTFLDAIKGNPEAMKEFVATYLLPAAMALVIMIAGYMVAAFIGRIVGQVVSQQVDMTLGKFLGKMVANVVMILFVIGVLGFFGVDVTSFAAILAAAGFAIGMALQGTLSNFAAGVMLLIFRPFRVDDYIQVSGIEGTVDEIDLFTTRLNSRDNRHLIVPNSQVFGSVIENFTRNDLRRVDVNVGVSYQADIRRTRQVLADAISVIPGGVTHPHPDVYLKELGESSVNWQLRVWARPENYWDVRQRMTVAAKEALDAAQIGIPYPQLDLHLVSGLRELRAAS